MTYRVLLPDHAPIECDTPDEAMALVGSLVSAEPIWSLRARCGRSYQYPGWQLRHERSCFLCAELKEQAGK